MFLQEQKEAPEGEAAAEDAEEANALEGDPETEAAGLEQAGSRAMPMRMGVDAPGHGVAEEAAERAAAAGAGGASAPAFTGTGLLLNAHFSQCLLTEPVMCNTTHPTDQTSQSC